jgi:integrase
LYLVPALGGRPLAALTGDNVRAYRMWLERSGLAANTVLHVLSDLRALLAWAVAEGRLARSPFPRRVLPRISELPPRGFTESDRFDLVLIDEPWGFVLRLLIGTGMRWSEACRARREHVQNGALVIAETKSGRVRRVPLMGDLLYEVLAREGRLVPYATGSPGSFSRTVRSKCGVKDFHVHRCRHTFAMRWLAAGGSLPVLQELLGHRDLSTTMRYAKVSEELVRREAERVAKRLDRDEF